jgi:hypothetical protein
MKRDELRLEVLKLVLSRSPHLGVKAIAEAKVLEAYVSEEPKVSHTPVKKSRGKKADNVNILS